MFQLEDIGAVTDVPPFHFFYIYLAMFVLWIALFSEPEAGRHAPLLMGEQVQGLDTECGKEYRRQQERENSLRTCLLKLGSRSSCGQSPPHLYSKESFHPSISRKPDGQRSTVMLLRGHRAQGEHLSSTVLTGRALLLHRGTISKQHNFAILISDCGWGLVCPSPLSLSTPLKWLGALPSSISKFQGL